MRVQNLNKNKTTQSLLTAALMALAMFAIVFFNLRTNQPPAVMPFDAPEDVFSSERAASHLPHIASKPNPIGSQANEEVRLYIIEQLEQLGLTPELHNTKLFDNYPHFQRLTSLKNVLAKIPGTEGSQTIMIMGHYDTVVNAPGASDNGAAVVTMLEAIRMLRHHPPLKNDLIFFFPDGEEVGLLGARAFKEEHRWAENIDLIINLEAMGTSGQSIMFETGENNLNAIREFAKATPYPIANSLSVEVYKRIGTATDYNVFKHDGYQGLNFAYIGSSYDYHTAGDNIENTDLRSIQHHGSYLASMLLHFGNTLFDVHAEQDAVYFNTIRFGFVYYPYSYVPYISIFILLLAFAIVVWGVKNKSTSLLNVLYSFVSYTVHLVIAYLAFNAIYEIIASHYPDGSHRLLDYNRRGLLLGFGLMAVAFSMFYFRMIIRGARGYEIMFLFSWVIILLWWSGDVSLLTTGLVVLMAAWVYVFHRKPKKPAELASGAIVFWAILATAVSFMLPGASYLLSWPLFFSLIPLGFIIYKRNTEVSGGATAVLLLVFSIPVLCWFPVIMVLFLQAMGLGVIGIIMLVVALVMGLLVLHSHLLTRTKAWLIPGVLFLAGFGIMLGHAVVLEYDERHRKQNHVVFASDGVNEETFWLGSQDLWTEQFLTDEPDSLIYSRFYPHLDTRVPATKTALPPLPPPDVKILSDSIVDGQRRLDLRVLPGIQPTLVSFFIQSGEQTPAIAVDGLSRYNMQPLFETGWHRLAYLAPPDEGILLSVFTTVEAKIMMRILEEDHTGIPENIEHVARPPNMMAAGDRTISIHAFEF